MRKHDVVTSTVEGGGKTSGNVSVSVGIVVHRDDPESHIYQQTLFVVRDDGMLGIPAGHLELGETPVQCAEREFLEETGHEITLIGIQKVVTIADLETEKTSIGFIFRGEIGKQVSEGEHGVRWLTADETIELLDQTYLPQIHIPAVWGKDVYPVEIFFKEPLWR